MTTNLYLRSALDGSPCELGKVFEKDGRRALFVKAFAPSRAHPRGIVSVLLEGDTAETLYYPEQVNTEFAPIGSPFFSQKLRNELRDRSHAILEETLTYEDEGVEDDPFGGREGLAAITLDGISSEALKEYHLLCEAFSPEAALAEATRHVYEP